MNEQATEILKVSDARRNSSPREKTKNGEGIIYVIYLLVLGFELSSHL
jgi:hypothetical protein